MKTMDRLRDLVEYLDRIGMENTSKELSDLMDTVKAQRRESIPRAAYERKKAGWLAHIRECETALAKRNLRIRELEKELEGTLRRTAELECTCVELKARRTKLADENDTLRNELADIRGRTMPEGMEWLLDVWPKWSNGEYCKFGDWWKSDKYGKFEPQQFSKLSIYTPEQLDEWGQGDGDNYGYEWDFMRPSDPKYRPDKAEPPAPKVLDAGGVEVHKGDTVWSLGGGGPYTAAGFDGGTPYVLCDDGAGNVPALEPSALTHRAPVLAADGKPLEVGQTVYHIADGKEYTVEELFKYGAMVTPDGITGGRCRAEYLTHHRPVIAADGKPLREGETVWSVSGLTEYRVLRFENGLVYVENSRNKFVCSYREPKELTHDGQDSFARIWDDAFNGLITWQEMERRARALAERGQ